jgi:tetratricopeptide (TPR) repeat protein
MRERVGMRVVVHRNLYRVAAARMVARCAASCASRTPPAVPGAAKYPDFMFPGVPAALANARGAERVDRGWQFLQSDSLRNAEREFSAALKQTPGLYPAQTGSAYVELAHKNYDRARTGFERALMADARYVPALVGRGQALLALNRDDEAVMAFESALAVDPSLADLRARIDVIRFRSVQALIASARTAGSQGRLEDARGAYTRALAASPDTAFLYRELGIIERRVGDGTAALAHFQRATTLDRTDAVSFVQTGEILEAMMDFAGAEAAYRAASAIEPTPETAARLAGVAAKARDARLPAPYRAIPSAAQITRGDLAALIGIRLEDVLRGAQRQPEVMTDLGGHWSASYATQVVRAGVMDAFENHTFQPGARVRRVDLAVAVSRLLTRIAATRPELRARLAARPTIADVAPRHVNYPQIAAAVVSGAMPLLPGDRFDVAGTVAGTEAIETLDRVRALAGPAR